jgi:hypothetical protein
VPTQETWRTARPMSWDHLTRVGDQWTLVRDEGGMEEPLDVLEAVAWLKENDLVLWDGMSWDGDKGDQLIYQAGQWTRNAWAFDPDNPDPPPGVLDSAGPGWHLFPFPTSVEQAWHWLEINGYRKPVPVQAVLDKAVPVGPTEYRFTRHGDYWEVQFNADKPTLIRDMDGMGYIALLLRQPQLPFPAVDLVALVKPPPPRKEDKGRPVADRDLLKEDSVSEPLGDPVGLWEARIFANAFDRSSTRGTTDSEARYEGGPVRRKVGKKRELSLVN